MQYVNRICLAIPCNIPGYKANANSTRFCISRQELKPIVNKIDAPFLFGSNEANSQLVTLSSSSFMRAVTKLMKIFCKIRKWGSLIAAKETSLILGNYANMLLRGKFKEFPNIQNEQLQAKYLMSKNHMGHFCTFHWQVLESAK